MLSTICIRMFVDMSSVSKKDSANLYLFIRSWLWSLMLNCFLAISFQRIVMLLINLHTVNTSLCNLETVSMSNLQLFLHQSFLLDHTITYSNTSRLLRYLLDIGNHIKIYFWWDIKCYCKGNSIYQEAFNSKVIVKKSMHLSNSIFLDKWYSIKLDAVNLEIIKLTLSQIGIQLLINRREIHHNFLIVLCIIKHHLKHNQNMG